MAARPSGRAPDELRAIRFTRQFTQHAEGSVLVEFGNTRVLCTASVEEVVPGFLRGKNQGWVTAEYGMSPRAVTNLAALGERTITLDCDVLQADGGTRTAAITGGYVALADACDALLAKRF